MGQTDGRTDTRPLLYVYGCGVRARRSSAVKYYAYAAVPCIDRRCLMFLSRLRNTEVVVYDHHHHHLAAAAAAVSRPGEGGGARRIIQSPSSTPVIE